MKVIEGTINEKTEDIYQRILAEKSDFIGNVENTKESTKTLDLQVVMW